MGVNSSRIISVPFTSLYLQTCFCMPTYATNNEIAAAYFSSTVYNHEWCVVFLYVDWSLVRVG